MAKYIYDHALWPHFTWNEQAVSVLLGSVRYLQGKLLGQMGSLGFSMRQEAILSTITLDVIKSSEIEGEHYHPEQVRSSIARRLGIKYTGMVHAERVVEGVVEMMLDATQNYSQTLDDERLFNWHAALFPTGRSGMRLIDTACYRKDDTYVVSGEEGNEKIHYKAPPPERVKAEMDRFLLWFNNDNTIDPVLKAAIAHFWFIIIHPFEDGNGRIARAISDLMLARSDNSAQRFYSLSNQIHNERKHYYAILKKVQYSTGNITEWLDWFLNCMHRALENAMENTQKALRKTDFWDKHRKTEINARQRLMLNKLLDGFDGKLRTSKWAKITKCSPDTALRDIKDLIEKGILKQEAGGGRSTNYELLRG